ncbi:MAG TPA: uroporphyrinogen-III C-methyltransferase, partial [Gammaproteobacteria bacterium]
MSKQDSSSESGRNATEQADESGEPVARGDESGDREPLETTAEGEASATVVASSDEPASKDRREAPDTDSEPAPDSLTETDAEAASAGEIETASGDSAGTEQPSGDSEPVGEALPPPKPPKRRMSWFGLFNFLLILAIVGAGGYYWWLEQQVLKDYDATIADLRAQLQTKAAGSRLDSGLSSVRGEIGGLERKLGELETGQQGLRESSEKLYELFGRDRADWQLAEVEYLMRVAQHKLILENDFAGAAITLQAASDRIGLTGDPGLLPVRITISEEIAELKTRERPDLVGMTLTLARLARQARRLQPGFAPRIDESGEIQAPVQAPEDWRDRVLEFIDSLVEVRHEAVAPTEIEANIVNVGETLEDNLKLARWAVLDRDARQYARLIDRSLQLMSEFYDLD